MAHHAGRVKLTWLRGSHRVAVTNSSELHVVFVPLARVALHYTVRSVRTTNPCHNGSDGNRWIPKY